MRTYQLDANIEKHALSRSGTDDEVRFVLDYNKLLGASGHDTAEPTMGVFRSEF